MIVEFRIPLPMKLEEFDKGWLYMVASASEDVSKGGDGGVTVLKNEPYDNTDGHLGTSEISGNVIPKNKGQYTLKQYFLGSRVPSWLSYLIPGDMFFLYEEAWNAFPNCITILTSKYFSNKKVRISVATNFFEGDPGINENAHDLNKEDLAARKVIDLDIADQLKDDKDYNAKYDPALVKLEKAGRGPLEKGWMKLPGVNPVMTAYKLIRVDFKVWGVQSRVENVIIENQKKMFLKTHGQAFAQLDEYIEMSMDDVRVMEDKAQAEMSKLRMEQEAAKGEDAKKPAAAAAQ
jgi:hypothetical protein